MVAARPNGFIEPCIPTRAVKPPAGTDWVHEINVPPTTCSCWAPPMVEAIHSTLRHECAILERNRPDI